MRRHDRPSRAAALEILLALVAAMVCGATRGAWAAEQDKAAATLVQQAIEQEIAGKPYDREKSLSAALDQSPKFEPALWQSGFVKFENQWYKFYQVPEMLAGRTSLVAYRSARAKAPETIEGQLELADLCAKRKLADQERAHLTKVLELDPDNAMARKRLGFVRVDNVWLSESEIKLSGKAADLAAAALKKWLPKLQTIQRGFERRDPRQREAAAKLVKAIDDTAAIPAMEVVLSTAHPEAAQAVIDTVVEMNSPEASLSLARHAVMAQWHDTRVAACEALRERDQQSFIPVLLAAMSMPIQSRAELYAGPGGRLMYGHAFFREGQQRKEMAVFLTAFQSVDGTDPRNLGLPIAEQTAAAREAAVAAQNNFTKQLNERICWVLANVTDQNFGLSPENWWAWWNTYNEIYQPEKPVASAYRFNEVAVATPLPPTPYALDCLAAGTPVWTESGAVDIEKIQVGDRVLSQDPETGELAYKPVLRTTVRPVSPLVELMLSKESITSSGGHPFWISGSGWVKAREVKEGMQLHGASGPALVTKVETKPAQVTYNLVVADFNTYFVGKTRVMSHDNTVRKATAAIVPGLVSYKRAE